MAKVETQKVVVVEITSANVIILRVVSVNKKIVILTKVFQEEKNMITLAEILKDIIIKRIIECPDLQDVVKGLLHVGEIEIIVYLLLLGGIVMEVYHQLQEGIEILHPFEGIEMIAFLLHGDGKGAQERFLNIQRRNLLYIVFRHLHTYTIKMKMFVLAIVMNLK
jgi:hypothetical protein